MGIKRTGVLLYGIILLWFMGSGQAVMSRDQSQPVRMESAAVGDCSVCHKEQEVLPVDHVQTADMSIDDCTGCHGAGGKVLRAIMPLSHVHQLSNIGCADCHEKPNSARYLSKEGCLSCHGSAEELAERTGKMDPNPHNSLHYGTDLDCDLCHLVHRKSENFCNQCHRFDFVVP